MRCPSSFTLSPGPTESPSLATWPLMVMWPWAMRISMLRREPWPDCAITFCRRSRFEGLDPPWRSALPRPLPKRFLPFCCGRAHSGTTPPGHSSLWLGWGLSLMGLRLLCGLLGVLCGGGGLLVDQGFLLGRRVGRGDREEGLCRLERGLQLVERRKLLERPQVQVVEEFSRGREKGGASGGLAVADGLDPAALFQRLQRGRRNRHATDFFDVAACHRLAVRDDGERLQYSPRVSRRLLAADAVEELLVLGLHAEAPAGG